MGWRVLEVCIAKAFDSGLSVLGGCLWSPVVDLDECNIVLYARKDLGALCLVILELLPLVVIWLHPGCPWCWRYVVFARGLDIIVLLEVHASTCHKR